MLGARSQQPFNGAASATDHTLLQKQQQPNSNQRRLFLSPQPNQTSPLSSSGSYLSSFGSGNGKPVLGQQQFGGSSGNLLDGSSASPSTRGMMTMSLNSEENNPDVPYYAELTAPTAKQSSNPGFLPAPFPLSEHLRNKNMQQHSQHMAELKNRVQRVEWKSADSLQSHHQFYNNPVASTNIGFGESKPSSWNPASVPGQVGLVASKSTGKLSTFDNNKSTLPLSLPPVIAHNGGASLLRKTEIPAKSPEYDQIKSPSEIAKERLEAMLAAKIGSANVSATADTCNNNVQGQSDKGDGGDDLKKSGDQVKVELNENCDGAIKDDDDENDNGTHVTGTIKNNKLESTGGTHVLPSSVLSNNSLNSSNNNSSPSTTILSSAAAQQKSGSGGAESTDCSSLGRSSTSDGDFGTLGGGGGNTGGGGGGSSCSGTFNMYTAHAGMLFSIFSVYDNFLEFEKMHRSTYGQTW